MNRTWGIRIIQAVIITLVTAAILQELEKSKDKRDWHGKLASFIPYDFRIPTPERFKDSYWNRYEKRILTPAVFGVGWALNFYALLEILGIINQRLVSEENFLMPTSSIKEVLEQSQKSS